MRGSRALLALLAMLCIAAAADPTERLSDPMKEAHARTLFREIRCLVCQGESIDDSDADLAADLRRVIRGQIAAGRTDGEIRRFLTDRYGEFVLLRPRFSLANALLWCGPFLVAAGGGWWWLIRRRRTVEAESPLNAAEEARIRALEAADPGVTLPPEISSKSAPQLTER